MKRARINEVLITQENHSPGNAIALDKNVVEVTIRCSTDSLTNVLVGWNGNASKANLLQPSESTSYGRDGFYLDENVLYIDFDTDVAAAGGRALITIITDGGEIEEC